MKIKRELLISTSEHLINNRISKFEKGFKKIIGNTISYFDKGGEPERIYHVYTLGLLAILLMIILLNLTANLEMDDMIFY